MILVVDIGTSSIKAILFDDTAAIVHVEQRKYSLKYIGDSVAMDMEVFTDALCFVLGRSGDYISESGITLDCVSVTGQRASVIPVDSCGHPLSDAIMWQDCRASDICKRFKPEEEWIYSVSGLRLSTIFSAPRMVLLKENSPELYSDAYRLVGFCEYVIHFLTDIFATDISIASRTCLFDISSLSYSERLLDFFGIDPSKLCDILPQGAIVGDLSLMGRELLRQNAPIPVILTGGDQQNASLGNGCMDDTSLAVNIGTGGYVISTSDKPSLSYKDGISVNASALKGKWIREASILSACKTQDWVCSIFLGSSDHLGYVEFDSLAATSPPGANGVRLDIDFCGRGTPDWNPEIRGKISGLSCKVTKSDIARATLEGIAASVSRCMKHLHISEKVSIRLSGGLSNSAIFRQILASLTGIQVERFDTAEATAIGSFVSAAVSMGLYSDHISAWKHAIERVGCVEVVPEAENTKIYQDLRLDVDNK